MTEVFLTGKRGERFRALQGAIVPRTREFDAAQRRSSDELVNGMLADQPCAVRCKLVLFLLVIDAVAFVHGGKSFRRLSSERGERILRFFFDSPIALFRKGFWGVSTLAKMGAYGQASVYDEIGYKLRPTP